MSSEASDAFPRITSDHWQLRDTLDRLPLPATAKWPHGVFDVEVFRQAGISLSAFAPKLADFQTPHEQDEIYIIASWQGELHLQDKVYNARKGDALFVAAGTPHRFQHFSDDFTMWVIFFPRPDAAFSKKRNQMNRKILTAMLALAVSMSASAAEISKAHAQLPPDLAQAVAEFDQAQIHGDGKALARLLADDYALVNSQGKTENKADFINDYTDPGFKLEPYVVEGEIIRSWNDGAVLGGVATLQGTSDGKPFKARLHFADIWRKRGGKWQVIFTQAMRDPAH